MQQVINYINIISDTCDKYNKEETIDILTDAYLQAEDKIAFVTALIAFAADQRKNVKLYAKAITRTKEGE